MLGEKKGYFLLVNNFIKLFKNYERVYGVKMMIENGEWYRIWQSVDGKRVKMRDFDRAEYIEGKTLFFRFIVTVTGE